MPSTLTAHGVLRPDGWIELRGTLELPLEPQDVEVVVTLSDPTAARDEFVDAQMPYISAPFDLPYLTPGRPIKVRRGTGEYLPPSVTELIEDVPE